MQEMIKIKYTGKIKSYQGQYGFIESKLGETFFHKTGIKSDFHPQINDEIEFQVEPSKKKQGKIQACEIVLIKKRVDNEISEEVGNRLIGIVKWFDNSKGFGIIQSAEGSDYFLRKVDVQSKFISTGNVVVFFGTNKNEKKIALKCNHTFGYKDWKLAFSYIDKDDIVRTEYGNVSIVKSTLDLLLKDKESVSYNELCFLSLDLLQTKFADEGYKLIKEIIALNKINEEEKNIFLKSAFEKAIGEYQYRILFKDNLIDIQKETIESQIELLQKFKRLNSFEINSIVRSDKIKETVKGAFLKSAFEKTNAECQYSMLFEDNLIDIQKETTESQIELLQKIESLELYRIKSITQSDKIKETVKGAFLKSAFEKASTENKYKMLFEDNLIDIQKETTESQIEFLQKYLSELGRVGDSNYYRIKSIAQSDKIKETVKGAFLKSAFEKACTECQYKMLFVDNLIDIQKETTERQIELLHKFERLHYWEIKTIAQSDKIEETVKSAFLKSVFTETSDDYQQYRMVFEDNLIDIQKETTKSQIKLLRKFESFGIDSIKTIAQSDKIEATLKSAFLKSAFKNSDVEDQYEMLFEYNLLDIKKQTIESQIEFLQKYLLILKKVDIDLWRNVDDQDWKYNKIKIIALSNLIEKKAKDIFLKSAFEKASTEYKYKMLFEDNLIDIQKETTESQIEFIEKYLSELGRVGDSNYYRIKSIAQSDKIKEPVKGTFLKSAFEKAWTECQYKMLFEDNLIDIQKETTENQIKLLHELERLDIDKIKTIARSDKIEATVKSAFLKSAFEKASAEVQYKMLFEYNLIDIQKETSESQNELFRKFENLDFDSIKTISQSDKIEATIKNAFLKSAFEKASAEVQYKMLFEDNLIDIQKETTESQIEFLQKILLKLDKVDKDLGWKVDYRDWKYNKIKIIALSNLIEKKAKDIFLKSAFEKARTRDQYKMLFEDNFIDIQNETSESRIELLSEFESLDFDSIKTISQSDKIEETVKGTFLKSAFEKASTKDQYKMLFEDNLIDIQKETTESQIELLSKFEELDIDKIKTIAQSDKIEATVKSAFLTSVFEKASTEEYQYKMLFEDNLIDIQKETTKNQIEFLQKYLLKLDKVNMYLGWNADDRDLKYNKIKIIALSDKIKETVKISFLKSAFEKLSIKYQYIMLFEDNLIDIQKESTESQIELLQKLERLDIDKIKTIAQSDKIEATVKSTFLKSAFKEASARDQIEILKDESLINGVPKKLEFLIIATKSGGSKFSNRSFSYLYYLENDIDYLHKNFENKDEKIKKFYCIVETKKRKGKTYWYGYKMEYYNVYKLTETYHYCKEVWCSILVEIYQAIDNQELFANVKTEDIFARITQLVEIRELYEIFKIDFDKSKYDNFLKYAIEHLDFNFIDYIKNYEWLTYVKNYNRESYAILFEQNYAKISKFDRLQLWLRYLNIHYNYLELVQSAWQLTNDERKLFNKRIKEQAKEERLQKFFDQIPNAEIIDETEETKTYKCKWRNLYYKNGSIQVFFDKYTSSDDYQWESAREEWNLLTQEYFNNRRIDDIITTVNINNQITKISGLEDIEVKIVIAEVRKNGSTERKTSITASQLSKIIHNISARNQCINFLARQKSTHNVLDIQELVTDDYGSSRRDVSFMFPIPNGKSIVYLIWESVEFERSKATHIFKCTEEEVEEMESKIKDFIENNFRTRSRLNSSAYEDIEVKRELQYFCRVNHDSVEYQVWENRMREVLPFLK